MMVICVLRSGGIYDASWVGKLKSQVARHLKEPHRFICLSDMPCPAERIPLKHDWPAWWAKIEMFRINGPALFIDLDTVVVGDMADIAEQARNTEFTALRDFYSEAWIGSGLMAWNGSMRRLYDTFAADALGIMSKYKTRGDQAFIGDQIKTAVRWQDALPNQVVSYKVHVRKTKIPGREYGTGAIPSDARVVCLHGHPKFEAMDEGDPVRKVWDEAA